MEWYWQRKIEVLGGKLAPGPLFPPQISFSSQTQYSHNDKRKRMYDACKKYAHSGLMDFIPFWSKQLSEDSHSDSIWKGVLAFIRIVGKNMLAMLSAYSRPIYGNKHEPVFPQGIPRFTCLSPAAAATRECMDYRSSWKYQKTRNYSRHSNIKKQLTSFKYKETTHIIQI